MKFVVFGGENRVGVLQGEDVLDISTAAHGESGFASLLALIEAGEEGLQRAQRTAEAAQAKGLSQKVSQAKLQAPWPGQRMAMAGRNSSKHVSQYYTNMGQPMSREEVYAQSRKGAPGGFWATARPIMGPDAQIQIPARAKGFFDYEGEAAAIIGKRGKDIKVEDAMDYLWGVTLVNDWSAREEEFPPKPSNPFIFQKTFDCSKSIGPAICVGEVDINDFRIETLVNGEVRQDYRTSEMTFSFAEFLAYLSQDFTFHPGDIITLGTGEGTGIDTTKPGPDGRWPKDFFLNPGDTVEVRSEKIGSLVGHVVEKST